jgi:hypothetical protein
LLLVPTTARAALMADPATLYAQMRDAYDKGSAHGWAYRDQGNYYATILNAGRAYSLQHPDDPAYGQLATLTVQIGAGIHYEPLTNHDGATWWVREAALWVEKNANDTTLVQQAGDLLARLDAMDDPATLARYADEDASANLKIYARDNDALMRQVEADWRAWVLTGDSQWRSLAFSRASQPGFPLAYLPTTWAPGFLQAAKNEAPALYARAQKIPELRVIATVTAMPYEKYMSTLAPADEYFGPLGMSVIGIKNQMKRTNDMLDLGWGDRVSGDAVQVAVAIDDLHKVYPRDRDLPALLSDCYALLGRFTTSESHQAAAHVRTILIIEYQDSPQAKAMLGSE